jgi:hypothetical protein
MRWYSIILPVAAFVSGCSVTRPAPANPTALREYLDRRGEANLRVTDRSGDRYWLHAPVIRHDSLVGRHGYDRPYAPVAVPLDQVVSVEVSRFSWGRTAALTGGVLAAAFTTLALLISEAEGTPIEP